MKTPISLFSWTMCSLFCIILILSEKTDGTSNVSIVILREPQQINWNEKFASIFSKIGDSQKIALNVIHVEINRKQEVDYLTKLCSRLSAGVTLIVDITSDLVAPNIVQLIRSSNIPYVHVDITIRPFVRAFFKFVEYNKVNDVGLIFSNEEERYEGIDEILNQYSTRTFTFNGLNKTAAERIIKLRPVSPHYAIFARPSEMTSLLENAVKYKTMERPSSWYLFFTDFMDENTLQTTIRMYPELKSFSLSSKMCCVYLKKNSDKNCICHGKIQFSDIFIHDLVNSLVSTTSVRKIQSNSLDCTILSESSNTESSSLQLNQTEFEAHLFETVSDSSTIRFFNSSKFKLEYYVDVMVFGSEPYNVQLDETPVLTELVTIDNSALNIMVNVSLKPSRRFFRIGVVQAAPWSYVKLDPITSAPMMDEKMNFLWDGYCIDFVQHLSKVMEFDYVLVQPKSGYLGELVNGMNNTWDGLVGDLMTGEIDIAVAPLKTTSDREEVIDFVEPIFEETGISIVIRKPVVKTSLFKTLTVIRIEVWLSIVSIILIASILLWILDKYSPYSGMNNEDAYSEPCRKFTITESLWFAITSFLPQGPGEPPKSLSSRILVSSFWLFVMLILATFEANLAALLSIESTQTSIQSLEQLSKQSRINYTVVEGSDAHNYFINMKLAEDTLHRMWMELVLNSSSDETQYRIWDYPIKEQYGSILNAIQFAKPVANASEGIKKVKEHVDGDFAFIHDALDIKLELLKSCDLIEVGKVFAEQPYALAIQQGSHLMVELSLAIVKLHNNRLFDNLTAKYWDDSKAECSSSDGIDAITLQSLGGIFILTLIGLALALITLIAEKCYYRHRRSVEDAVQQLSNN